MGTHKPVPPRPFTPRNSTNPPPVVPGEIPSFASPFTPDDATTIYRARRNAEAAQAEPKNNKSSPTGITGPPRGLADADQTKIFHAPDELLEQAKRKRAERRSRSKSALAAQKGVETSPTPAAPDDIEDRTSQRESLEGDTLPPPERPTVPPSNPISVLPTEPVVVLQHAIGDRLEERDTSIFRVQEDLAVKARETRARRKEQRAAGRANSAPDSARTESEASAPFAPAPVTRSAPVQPPPSQSAPARSAPVQPVSNRLPPPPFPVRPPSDSAPTLADEPATSSASAAAAPAPQPGSAEKRGPVLLLADVDVDVESPVENESIPPFRKTRVGIWIAITALSAAAATAYALRGMF